MGTPNSAEPDLISRLASYGTALTAVVLAWVFGWWMLAFIAGVFCLVAAIGVLFGFEDDEPIGDDVGRQPNGPTPPPERTI